MSKVRTDIDIVLGPPGTGKTTYLIGDVQKLLEAGTQPDRIAYLSFSRAAATEARTRAMMKLNIEQAKLDKFSTLHSIAFRSLKLKWGSLMDGEMWNAFSVWSRVFNFTLNKTDRWDKDLSGQSFYGQIMMAAAKTKNMEMGDECLIVYAMMRNALVSKVEAMKQIAFSLGKPLKVDVKIMNEFIERLEFFKESRGLFDFYDIIDESKHKLDVDKVYLDEAQDLTPQQWRFFWQLVEKVPSITIAGDDDQAIFEYAGTSSEIFRNLEGRRKVLHHSYRLPRAVYKRALYILDTIRDRIPKDFEPRDAEGEVRYFNQIADLSEDLKTESWIFVARSNMQVRAFIQHVRRMGFVYEYKGFWSNQTKQVRAVLTYEQLRAGRGVTDTDAIKNLFELSGLENMKFEGRDEYYWEDFDLPWNRKEDWMTALIWMSDDDREYIRLLRSKGESLVSPGRIRLMTIHASKGLEADNVIINPDSRRSILKDTDSERRIWYVAATRARKRLFILRPKNTVYFRPLLG